MRSAKNASRVEKRSSIVAMEVRVDLAKALGDPGEEGPQYDEIARIMRGLEAGGAHEDTLTPANRHGPGRGSATAAIYEFVPRKGPGTEAPGQVEGGEPNGGGNVPIRLMLAAGQRGIRGQRKLG